MHYLKQRLACPTAEIIAARKEFIVKGMIMTADVGGPVMITKHAPARDRATLALPDLAPIAQRIAQLQTRVDAVLKVLRK